MEKGLGYKEELVLYIKKNLKKGYTKESLKWALVSQGHSKIEIQKALDKAEEEMAKEAPIMETKPKITYEVIDEQGNTLTTDPKASKKPFWKKWFG